MIDTPQQLLFQKFDQTTIPMGQRWPIQDESWAVVLANGEQPEHEVPMQLLQTAPFIVCCDGAILKCDWADAAVGDGDSTPSWAREEYESIFHLESEQNDNDLTKATHFCISKGFHRIVYLGATGMREDHTMANISLLMRYAKVFGVEAMMVTNYGWFNTVTPSVGIPQGDGQYVCQFQSFPSQQVSIFNFGCKQLRTEGLRYHGYPFEALWQGTLNEATDDHFNIIADGNYLLYRTFCNK